MSLLRDTFSNSHELKEQAIAPFLVMSGTRTISPVKQGTKGKGTGVRVDFTGSEIVRNSASQPAV